LRVDGGAGLGEEKRDGRNGEGERHGVDSENRVSGRGFSAGFSAGFKTQTAETGS
jgi:hypothetical protein